jgi:hypothetical protein
MRRWILIGLVALVACGTAEEQHAATEAAPPAAPLAAPVTPPPAEVAPRRPEVAPPPPRAAALATALANRVYWDGGDPQPDLSKHVEFCDAIVGVDPRTEGKPGVRFLGVLRCLEELGWKQRPATSG